MITSNLVPLSGGDIHDLLRVALTRAARRIWVTQFIVDARPVDDRAGMVRALLRDLATAAMRGVDVRILLPTLSAPSGKPYDINAPAAQFLTARGVSVRRYVGSRQRPHLHAKMVIVDDHLLVCSNANWTHSAWRRNAELGIAVHSDDLAAMGGRRFEALWTRRGQPRSDALDPVVRRIRRRAPLLSRRQGQFPWSAANSPHASTLGTFSELVGQIRTVPELQLLAGQQYLRAVRSLVDAAQSHVLVAMLGLRASTVPRLRVLLESLKAAVQRGVDVRFIYQVMDGPHTDWTADIAYLKSVGVKTRPWQSNARMHTRALTIDDEHFVVGSVGWTPQSIFLSEELSVHARQSRVATQLRESFETWWVGGGQSGRDNIRDPVTRVSSRVNPHADTGTALPRAPGCERGSTILANCDPLSGDQQNAKGRR